MEKRTWCNKKEIINRKDYANDWEYITEKILKEKCSCAQKSTCFQILKLLGDWKREEATDLVYNEQTDA